MAPDPNHKPEKKSTVCNNNSKIKTKRKSSKVKSSLIDLVMKKLKNKELTLEEASEKYNISYKTLCQRVRCLLCNTNHFTNTCPVLVFTTEQQNSLRDHIIKCSKTQYGLTNITIRKMAYDYAIKLPYCDYPKKWDEMKMASMDWYLGFRTRHPLLKKSLAKTLQHTCICIKGCHMGPEGKEALEQLQAKLVISRVFHYLQKEYEYMKMCNDLGLLVNILRRTAEATGVCEQTIASILEDEKREAEELHRNLPERIEKKMKKQKKNVSVSMDHDYIENGGENKPNDTVNEGENGPNNNRVDEYVRPVAENINIDVMETEPTIVSTFPRGSGRRSRSLSQTLAESPMVALEVVTTEPAEVDTSRVVNANGVTNGVADDGQRPRFSINIEYTDFERLQQNASLIKSVEVEILEDDFDEPEDFNRTLVINDKECHTTTRSEDLEDTPLVIDDDECRTTGPEEDMEDRALVIDTNKCQTNGQEDLEDVSLVIDDTDACPSLSQNDQDDADYKINEYPIDIEHSKINGQVETKNDKINMELSSNVSTKINEPIENGNIKSNMDVSNRVPTQLNELIDSENEKLNILYISNIVSTKPNGHHGVRARENIMNVKSIDVVPKKPKRSHYADKNQRNQDTIDVTPKKDLYELVKSNLRDRQRSISTLIALLPKGLSPKENSSLLRKISLFIDGARAKKKKAGYEGRFISRYGEWLDTEIDWFNEGSRDSKKIPA